MFNAKGRVSPDGIQIEFFDVVDVTETWSRCEIVLERFDLLHRPFSQRLNPPVREILDVSNYLMTGGGALGKEAITHALHVAGDEEAARDFTGF
jgi:hypothetical protein